MEIQGTAHVAFLTAEFFLPEAESLKAKRMILNRMRDRVHNTFNVSAAEIAYQDKWQRSQWAFCVVGSDKAYVDGAVQKLVEFLGAGREAHLTDYQIEFL
jgi:uncharacterized protein YlxP (DUF503 family)